MSVSAISFLYFLTSLYRRDTEKKSNQIPQYGTNF